MNQSIHQISLAPVSPALPGSVAQQFNSKIDEAVSKHQQAIRHASVYGVKAKSKICVLRHFLKVGIELVEWTVGGCSKGKGHKNEMPLHLLWSLP